MKRRAKLSLGPDQKIRREPPKGFLPVGGPGVAHTDSSGTRTVSGLDGPDKIPRKASGADSPIPAAVSGTAESGPQPSHTAARQRQASTAAPAPNGWRFDRAIMVKVLLAAGVAAIAILLLKRRLY